MTMFTVGGDNRVVRFERLHRTDCDCLFSNVEVEKTTDFGGAVEFGTFLFKATDAEHLTEQEQGVITLERKL
jgi:hypothetical protein